MISDPIREQFVKDVERLVIGQHTRSSDLFKITGVRQKRTDVFLGSEFNPAHITYSSNGELLTFDRIYNTG